MKAVRSSVLEVTGVTSTVSEVQHSHGSISLVAAAGDMASSIPVSERT